MSDPELLEEAWDHILYPVDVPKNKSVYRAGPRADLPELINTQVIASRDPRLSPTIATTSVYSRDFPFEDHWSDEGDDDSDSFHSEDWYCQDVGESFEEEAKNLKVRIHINPKFFPNLNSTTDIEHDNTLESDVDGEKVSTRLGEGRTRSRRLDEIRKPYQGQMPGWMKEYLEESRAAKLEPSEVDSAKVGKDKSSETSTARSSGQTETERGRNHPSPKGDVVQVNPRKEHPDREATSENSEKKSFYEKTGSGLPCSENEGMPILPLAETSRTREEKSKVKPVSTSATDSDQASKAKPYSDQAWLEATQEFLDEAKKTKTSSTSSKPPAPKEGYCTDAKKKRSRSKSGSRRYPIRDTVSHGDMTAREEPPVQVNIPQSVMEDTTPPKKSKAPNKQPSRDKDREDEDIVLDPRVPDIYRAEMEEKIQEERRRKREARLEEMKSPHLSIGEKLKQIAGSNSGKQSDEAEPSPKKMALNKLERRPEKLAHTDDSHKKDTDKKSRRRSSQDVKSARTTHVVPVKSEDKLNRSKTNEQGRIPKEGKHSTPSEQPRKSKQKQHMDSEKHKPVSPHHEKKKFSDAAWKPVPICESAEISKVIQANVVETSVSAATKDSPRIHDPAEPSPVREHIKSPETNRSQESKSKRSKRIKPEDPKHIQVESTKIPPEPKQEHQQVTQKLCRKDIPMTDIPLEIELEHNHDHSISRSAAHTRPATTATDIPKKDRSRRRQIVSPPRSPLDEEQDKRKYDQDMRQEYVPNEKSENIKRQSKLQTQQAGSSRHNLLPRTDRSDVRLGRAEYPYDPDEPQKAGNEIQRTEAIQAQKNNDVPLPARSDSRRKTQSDHFWQSRNLREDLPPCKMFKPLSKYMTKVLNEQCPQENGRRVDTLVSGEQQQLVADLENICQGNKPLMQSGMPYKHFPPLSLNSELESTFIESPTVKRTYLQELKEWMTKKPLESYLVGRLSLEGKMPGEIPGSLKVDQTIKECANSFHEEMYTMLKSDDSTPDPQNVFPVPKSSTEETTDQVFRQVTKYMDFLASKSFLVEQEQQQTKGSQWLERTKIKLVNDRLPQGKTSRLRTALDDRTNDHALNSGYLDNRPPVSASASTVLQPVQTAQESQNIERREGNTCDVINRQSHTGVHIADGNGGNRVAPVEQRGQPRAQIASRDWNSRTGFVDRMEAIMVDREYPREIHPMKTIPLEPNDVSGSAAQKVEQARKPSTEQVYSSSQNIQPRAIQPKQHVGGAESSKQSKVSHGVAKTSEHTVSKSSHEGSRQSDVAPVSSSMMYSPTQPTAPEDIVEQLEMQATQDRQRKSSEGDGAKKRKGKDPETGMSKKKKKDKVKDTEESRKEEKKKKDKKDKKKEKKGRSKTEHKDDVRPSHDKIHKPRASTDEKVKVKEDEIQSQLGKEVKNQEPMKKDESNKSERELTHEELKSEDKTTKVKSQKIERKGKDDSIPRQRDHPPQPEDGEIMDDPHESANTSIPQQDPETLSQMFLKYFAKFNEELMKQCKDEPVDTKTFYSHIQEPENSFLWALLLAYYERQKEEIMAGLPEDFAECTGTDTKVQHTEVSKKSSSESSRSTGRKAHDTSAGECGSTSNEYGTPMEGVAVEITEYGSTQVKLLQTQEDRESGELTPDETKPEELDMGKEKKKGSSRLLQAFRQQVEAKKRANLTGEDKQRHLEKLSADKAAKKPAPKAAKPLFLPPSFAKPGDGTEIGEQMLAARKLGINLATTRETDIIIRQAFDMFAEKGANLVRQKLSNKLLDELAKGAQSLLANSASQLKHLDSLCGIALSIYKQLQEADITTGALKQEGSKTKPSSSTKHHKEKVSKKDEDKVDTSKKRRTTSDSWKDPGKRDGYMDESHATHMEDRSKITKDIMDGHERLDFEKDKSQKDLSRLRKIGRPSYLFSARIERLVAEQKGKEPSTDDVMEVTVEQAVAATQSVDISDEEPIIIPPPESTSEPENVPEQTIPIIVTEDMTIDSASGATAPEPNIPAAEHVDTEDDKSKKVGVSLPKGNKLMMAFRQAMLAKKRAQQKGGPSDTKNAGKIIHKFGVKPKAPAGDSQNVATQSLPKNELPARTASPVFVCNTQTVSTTTSTVSMTSIGSMTVTAALPSQSFANTFSSATPAPSTTDTPHSSVSANMSFPLSLKDSLRFAKKPEEMQAVASTKLTDIHVPATTIKSPAKTESQSRWGPLVSSAASLPPPAVVLAPTLVSVPPPPLPKTELEPPPLPDTEPINGPALLPTPPQAMISAPPVMAVPPPLPNKDTIMAQSAVISAPPVMSRPPPTGIPPPLSEPNASPALLPTPIIPAMMNLPAAALPQPSAGAAPGLLPTPPSTGMSSGLLPTPSSRPALLPTPGTPEAMIAAHYSSMASQGYMNRPSSVYQQPMYPHPPPFGGYPPSQPPAGSDYSQTPSVSELSHPPPPIPQQSSDSGEKTGELSAIPLPPPGQPDAESNLDKSVYDPDVMAQYQQKVQDFLQRKQTTPGPPPPNNQTYNNNNSWNQYYQNQGHSGPPSTPQGSQDQWQQQWHNYWSSVSGQYHNPSWNSSQWGRDYSQQWDNWNRWNQGTTPDLSQPPPGMSGPPGVNPPRGPPPLVPPPDSKSTDNEGNKDTLEQTKMAAMPLRPPVIAGDLRIYVHNLEREPCQRVQDFLLSIGAQTFDCNNLELLKVPQFPSLRYLVLVHSDDLQNLHKLPNLYGLRKEPKIQFATFSKAEEVMAKKQEPIMPQGGILLPDDLSLMGLVPSCLEMLLEFMLGEKKLERNWSLMIHKHLFTEIDKLRAEYREGSVDHQRLADLTQLLVRYEDKGVVETLTDHECAGTMRPSENYLPCCLQLQADGCLKYRQCYLISEIPQNHPAMGIFKSHGIGIMSLSTFLETVAHRPPADIMATPTPDHGRRESPLFRDSGLSSSLKSITIDVPALSVSRESLPQPVISDAGPEPGPPGIESGATTASNKVLVLESGTAHTLQYPRTDDDIEEVDMDVS